MQLTMPQKKAASRAPAIILLILLLCLAGAGLYLWHQAGRLSFTGIFEPSAHSLAFTRDGRVAAVEVRPGERVRRGQVLLRLDEEPLRLALREEEGRLGQLALTLPPSHISVPAPDRSDGRTAESLDERLDRRRRVEEEAERRMQAASDAEAQASIIYNRASMLAARGKITPEDRAAAEAALEAARLEKQAARDYYESVSLRRAETSADIRSLKAVQNAAGAAQLPVEARLAAYERQKVRVADARAALGAAELSAPSDGLIMDVLARPGENVRAAQPALAFRALEAGTVTARLPADAAGKLDAGRPCLLSLPGAAAPLKGYVASVPPDSAPPSEEAAHVEVRLALTPEAAATEAAHGLRDGDEIAVTVLLREPLFFPDVLPSVEEKAAPPALAQPASPAEGGRAAPPASPLSVHTPFGAEDPLTPPPARPAPPTVKAGGGGSLDLPKVSVPVLPPMPVPAELTGSPLPDPANNPSVAAPEVLDREGAAPR